MKCGLHVTSTNDRPPSTIPEAGEPTEWVSRMGPAPIATCPFSLQGEKRPVGPWGDPVQAEYSPTGPSVLLPCLQIASKNWPVKR